MINLSMAEPDNMLRPRISVVGVGGAGGNAINNMIRSNLEGCDFIVANTDAQALSLSSAPRKIQLGVNLSRGLGAGSKPEIGRAAAEEQIADVLSLLEGSDMVFLTAGMGGGTGTGATPVLARAARESGILTVGVVTKPFHFEGGQRMRQAEAGIAELQQYVDTLIVIPNQNLFRIANERTTIIEAFSLADEVLHCGVRGITDLMVMPGFMNLDFADVKTVMGEMGKAMMGTGEAEGENRAVRAAESAISNPLLDDVSMKGARGILINITGGLDMTLFEMDQAANRIREEIDPDAQIKVGSTFGEDLTGRIRVSVIATGIDAASMEKSKRSTSYIAPQQTAPIPTPSVRFVTEAPRQTAPVAVKPQATAPAPAAATPNVSTSYFSVSTSMETESEEPVAPAVEEPIQAVSEEIPEQTPIATAPIEQPPAAAARSVRSQSPLHHVSAVAAVQQRTAEASKSNDMRVTRISPTVTPQGSQATQRSQSLFHRITGFGMVRPSEEEEMEDIPSARTGTDNTSERPALSPESADLLDIPAFLRRQSNH